MKTLLIIAMIGLSGCNLQTFGTALNGFAAGARGESIASSGPGAISGGPGFHCTTIQHRPGLSFTDCD